MDSTLGSQGLPSRGNKASCVLNAHHSPGLPLLTLAAFLSDISALFSSLVPPDEPGYLPCCHPSYSNRNSQEKHRVWMRRGHCLTQTSHRPEASLSCLKGQHGSKPGQVKARADQAGASSKSLPSTHFTEEMPRKQKPENTLLPPPSAASKHRPLFP